jgi:hypothetical protein
MGILDQYGVKPYEQERERVQLAALKVSDGKVEKLKEQIAVAKEDYRDVLVLAEYPGWFRSVTGGNAPLKPKDDPEEKKIMEQDRKQYLEWIKGKP